MIWLLLVLIGAVAFAIGWEIAHAEEDESLHKFRH